MILDEFLPSLVAPLILVAMLPSLVALNLVAPLILGAMLPPLHLPRGQRSHKSNMG